MENQKRTLLRLIDNYVEHRFREAEQKTKIATMYRESVKIPNLFKR